MKRDGFHTDFEHTTFGQGSILPQSREATVRAAHSSPEIVRTSGTPGLSVTSNIGTSDETRSPSRSEAHSAFSKQPTRFSRRADEHGEPIVKARDAVLWSKVVDDLANALQVAIGKAALVRRNAQTTADEAFLLEGSIAGAVTTLKRLQPGSTHGRRRR